MNLRGDAQSAPYLAISRSG